MARNISRKLAALEVIPALTLLCISWILPVRCRAASLRDWKSQPAIVEVDGSPDIYALGDVHGDYDKLVTLLAGAGIIKPAPQRAEDVQWIAADAVLVCTGDIIDKWNQGLQVIRLMRALEASAQKAGGRVLVTLGNHEAEFLAGGGDNAKAAEFQHELEKEAISPSDVAAGRDAQGIGAWLRGRPIAVKIGDWFFCHAGNTHGMTLKALETAIEQGVDKDGYGTFFLAQPNSILEAKMHPVPWWIQTPSDDDANPSQGNGLARLRTYIAALGCKHLVVGHQPGSIKLSANIERPAGKPFAFEGLLFLIDTGMSRGVQDGQAVILFIHPGPKGTVTSVDATAKHSVLWVEP